MTSEARPRLQLRALRDADARLFCALYCDAETMRFVAPALARDQALASFHATLQATRRQRAPRFFVVLEGRPGRAIGLCSIQAIARRERAAELGIMLAPGARQRRLAQPAMRHLMRLAFETLSIDLIWVQYRAANVAAARLFAGLGFAPRLRARPRTARPTQTVRFLHRSTWQTISNQPCGGKCMSNIIGFLENVGRDAALRHASREQLLQAIRDEHLPAAQGAALTGADRGALDALLGTEHTLYCSNFPVKPPKKAPGKQPSKAPPKKAPPKKSKVQAHSAGASQAPGISQP